MVNQSSYERNVNILTCLASCEKGPWLNLRQVQTYMPGTRVDREIIREFLEDQVTIGNVDKREAKNEKATFEYIILEKGRNVLATFHNLHPDLKFVLGWKPSDNTKEERL